ncbi:MAG: O-acetyl-ADP-ribose deacetylase [Planctomycetota bacterium]
MIIEVLRDDITTLHVDAIVNAANERMLGGGGVDGAIHRAAGNELLAACKEIPEVRPGVRCPTGQCRMTAGYRLPAKYVVHAVGPKWKGGNHNEPDLLRSAYQSCLRIADQHQIESFAFPAISCGVYDFPIDQAAQIAVETVRAFGKQHDYPKRVVLVAFDRPVYDALLGAVS